MQFVEQASGNKNGFVNKILKGIRGTHTPSTLKLRRAQLNNFENKHFNSGKIRL